MSYLVSSVLSFASELVIESPRYCASATRATSRDRDSGADSCEVLHQYHIVCFFAICVNDFPEMGLRNESSDLMKFRDEREYFLSTSTKEETIL